MIRDVTFRRLTAACLAFTVLVILWGAFVRASGSGAGCGSHWPLCNGEIIPRPKSIATIIELTHRATSGLALLLVVAQVIGARRVLPRNHRARRAAVAGVILMITEALVGAGLVLFEMVAENKSIARGYWMAAHLTNTFALLVALTLTWWWARGRPAIITHVARFERTAARGLMVGAAGVLVVAVSGAITALGDTLFPVETLGAGIAQDLSPAAHLFVRLRIWHPVFAVATGLYLLAWLGYLTGRSGFEHARTVISLAAGLIILQLGIGFLNVFLLAPIPLQIIHLLIADLIWITLIILIVELRGAPASATPTQGE